MQCWPNSNTMQFNVIEQIQSSLMHWIICNATPRNATNCSFKVCSVDLTVTALRAPLTLPLSGGSKTSKQANHHHVIIAPYQHVTIIYSCECQSLINPAWIPVEQVRKGAEDGPDITIINYEIHCSLVSSSGKVSKCQQQQKDMSPRWKN